MRKSAVISVFLLLLAGILLLGQSAGFAAGFAQIENVAVGEVRPGEIFTVSFQVHNTLNDRLKYVVVKATSSTNFMPVGGDTWSSGGEVERNAAVSGRLSFRADENIVAGVYSIPVTLTSESKTLSGASFSGNVVNSLQTLSTSDYFYVKVEGTPSLVLTQKSSFPGLVEPGRETAVSFELHNNGTDSARNVLVRMDAPEGVEISSASREVFLGEIPPSGKAAFQVSLIPDRIPGRTEFGLPVEISFEGGASSEVERIFLKRTADLEVSGVPSGALVVGKNEQRLEVRIRNAGSAAAENIRLSLITDYPLTPSGRSSLIELLLPGEEGLATFTVDVDSKGALQDSPVQIAASFEERAERKSEILEARVPVSGAPPNYLFFVVVGALVAIGLFFKFGKGKTGKGSEGKK